jgi:diacylglycerol kinase (ATP)
LPEKLALIWNPASGRAKPEKLARAQKYFSEAGFEVEAFLTAKRGEGESLAREALDRGFKIIAACGGDGTINEVVQPMVLGGARLAVIPLGTVNVLARELGISSSFDKALEQAAKGKERKIWLGKVTLGENGLSRFFFLMAGIGFDAEVVHANKDNLKKTIGRFSYIWTAFETLLNFKPEKLRFLVDGERITGFHSIIGKASRYGGNFKVTRNASLFDPDIHILILKSPKKIHLLKLAWFILIKTLPCFEGSEFKVSRSIEVEGKAGIQIDGEYIGETPCTIRSADNCLGVII